MQKCNDPKCPVHGNIKVRGNILKGRVINAKAPKSVTIERELTQYVPKYERYKKVVSKIIAYKPDCMDVKEGDIITIGETRKLSKTKSFVVLEVKK